LRQRYSMMRDAPAAAVIGVIIAATLDNVHGDKVHIRQLANNAGRLVVIHRELAFRSGG
jgi:hypothetical protein